MDDKVKQMYLGKPENQKDPHALVPSKPKLGDAQPTARKSTKRLVPSKINKPTRLAQSQQNPTLPTSGDVGTSSFFAGSPQLLEVDLNTTFTPSTPMAVEVSRQTYNEMSSDDSHFQREVLPEYMDYYMTALIWLRVTSLKAKIGLQVLTQQERELLEITETKEFAIPEPFLLQLRMLGQIQTVGKQRLYPTFPDLPIEEVNGHGGFYGPISVHNHNEYEGIPCLGVLGQAVRASISNDQPGLYHSDLETEDLKPNENLLGFLPLGYRRPEAKNIAFRARITADVLPEAPAKTGFNIRLMDQVSAALAQTKSFKISTITVASLNEVGSIGQSMIVRTPEHTQALNSEKNDRILVQSALQESVCMVGATMLYAPQLYKSADTAATASTWSCVDQTPADWIANRNDRINSLPPLYREKVFETQSRNIMQYRTVMIRNMLLTKR